MSDVIKDTEAKMAKALEVLRQKYSGVRTGRASPALLEHLSIEYYGSHVSLKQLASVSIPEPRTLVIQPFDKGAMKEIEKAIQKSDLGLTPNTDGGVIRLNLPPLTEEKRKDLVKFTKREAEDTKVAVRNIRREAIDSLKALKLPQDEVKVKEEAIQKLTDKEIVEIDKVFVAKEKEILEV